MAGCLADLGIVEDRQRLPSYREGYIDTKSKVMLPIIMSAFASHANGETVSACKMHVCDLIH